MTEMTTTEISKRLWKALSPSAYAFVGLSAEPSSDVPMTLHADGDKQQSLWIFTVKQSRLVAGGRATARYISPHNDLFARISGTIENEWDDEVIDRLWSRQIAAWYKDGREDADLMVLRLDVEQAEVWASDMSPMTMIKMFIGANVQEDLKGHHATVLTP